jgi:hypothetical protein
VADQDQQSTDQPQGVKIIAPYLVHTPSLIQVRYLTKGSICFWRTYVQNGVRFVVTIGSGADVEAEPWIANAVNTFIAIARIISLQSIDPARASLHLPNGESIILVGRQLQ